MPPDFEDQHICGTDRQKAENDPCASALFITETFVNVLILQYIEFKLTVFILCRICHRGKRLEHENGYFDCNLIDNCLGVPVEIMV